MKKVVLVLSLCVTFGSVVHGQDEFILVNDFEMDVGRWTGWVQFADFTAPDEPRHGGEAAVMLDALNDSGWSDSRWTLPEPIDASEADEFRMWVYSEDIFRIRADLGVEVPMGFRYYGPDDVGTWKELVYWISEEQSTLWEELFSSMTQIRFWVNPDSETEGGVEYPEGFEGIIYIDDMTLRKRVPVEREYIPLIGFNEQSDEALVSLEYGGSFFEIDTSGDPPPTEGNGVLLYEFTSDWSNSITINLRDFPEIRQYDRIHMTIFVDGDPSNWAATSLVLRASWVDENGDTRGTGSTSLSENILGYAVGDWGEISGQYGSMDSEGYSLNWLFPEIEGVFDDPNGTLTLTLTSQGADGLDGVLTYVDNIRLSRPVGGVSVQDWELW